MAPLNSGAPLVVPILGGGAKVGAGKVGAQISALPRRLDEHGMLSADIVQGPQGQSVPRVLRESYMDAEELLAAIQALVRKEVREALMEDKAGA